MGSAFIGVTPARIMDTRNAPTIDHLGEGLGPLAAGGRVSLAVLGRAGLPDSGVGAVALNVTAVGATTDTYLTVWPLGAPRPIASNLNDGAAETVPNMVVVPVGAGGGIEVYNDRGSVDVLVDVLGWFPTGAGFTGLTPARLFDTRNAPTVDGQQSGGGPLGAAARTSIRVSGRGGVPTTGVGSVALNVTAVGSTGDSYLTVWPGGGERPVASNANVDRGRTVANMVIVPLGADGTVQAYNDAGRVDVVIDVLGWFAPGGVFTPLPGTRLMDTRDAPTADGLFRNSGPVPAHAPLELQVTGRGSIPSSGVGAVVLNVTAVGPTAASFVTVWPTGLAVPTASNLNLTSGRTTPNMVIVQVGAGGRVSLLDDAGSVDLVVDVLGWFPTG